MKYLFLLFVINFLIFSIESQEEKKQYDIVAFGMPVVDYILDYNHTSDTLNLVKTKLSYHMSSSSGLRELLKEVSKEKEVFNTIGGSSLNTLRTSNFILKENKKIFYIGGIGKDDFGKKIKNQLDKENIEYLLVESDVKTTSIILCLIYQNKDRETFASLESTQEVNYTHFNTTKVLNVLDNTKIFYTDAYLVEVLIDTYEFVFKYLYNTKTLIGIGMAQKEIIYNEKDKIKNILPYVDILFMNEGEFVALEKIYDFKDDNDFLNKFSKKEDFKDFFAYFSKFKKNKKKDLVFIVTQGKGDTIILIKNYTEDSIELINEPILIIDLKLEIDYNGAGDAFAGGFLAGLIEGKSYRDSAILGNIFASGAIRLKGFQVPQIDDERIEREYKIQYKLKEDNERKEREMENKGDL